MKITRVDSFLVEVPQKYPVAPYQSRYVSTSMAGALLFRLETDTGLVGWGETPQLLPFHNLPTFQGDEARELESKLLGKDPEDFDGLYGDWELGGPRLQSGVEMAMWDLAGKAANQPVYQLLGGACRREIEVACCMGIRPPEIAAEIVRSYVEAGFSTLKTKAGRSPEEDLAMVRAIRDAVGDRIKLRIDPNTSYSPEVTRQLARDLEPFQLEYLEQPMGEQEIEASAQLRKETSTPLALNESVTTREQVQRILDCQAADVLLPDTYQCGGIRAVKEITDQAAASGVTCVFHCAHDLELKTAAMLHVVAASPNMTLANDSTYYGLGGHLVKNPFVIKQSRIAVPDLPGLGVEIDLHQLRRFQVGRWTSSISF